MPTSKGGKGEQETRCWPGNRSSAHRKSAQMKFFSVSHPPVLFCFVFYPGENKLACQGETGEPTRPKAAMLGHELEGSSPGQQVGPAFCPGNGNPLQCSCLENPRDSGAWWAAVYGVTQSRTRLKRLNSGGPTGVPCEAGGVREARPITVFKGLAPSWQKTHLKCLSGI